MRLAILTYYVPTSPSSNRSLSICVSYNPPHTSNTTYLFFSPSLRPPFFFSEGKDRSLSICVTDSPHTSIPLPLLLVLTSLSLSLHPFILGSGPREEIWPQSLCVLQIRQQHLSEVGLGPPGRENSFLVSIVLLGWLEGGRKREVGRKRVGVPASSAFLTAVSHMILSE